MTTEQIAKLTPEQKMNLLQNNPLFQKMIEVATEKAKADPTFLENLDLNELKEAAQDSFYSKVVEFRNNKNDMNLLAKKVYTQIHINKLAEQL